jgi:pimeloyl-ACP methyl ester carboxylesterase
MMEKPSQKVRQKGSTMPFAELKDSIKIHYDLVGKGLGAGAAKVTSASASNATVLMACQKDGFEAGSVGAMLAANRPVLNYSYRGSGQSSAPKTLMEYSVADYREDTRQLLETVGMSTTSLIGYSHGGYFAADYALNYPQQVRALILVEPALFVDRAKLQARISLTREGSDDAIHLLMKQMMPEIPAGSPEYNEIVDAIKANYPNPIGLAGEWYARSTNDLGDNELRQIKVPTLVIGGERSWVRENIERTASLIPGAAHVRLDGTHNLMEERPAEVTAAIESFLAANGG